MKEINSQTLCFPSSPAEKRYIFQTFRMPFDGEKKDETGWAQSEDNIILHVVKSLNKNIWKTCAKILKKRNARECKKRFKFLNKHQRKGRWTKEEDEIILSLYEKFGKNWVLFSKILKTRTPKQIRIRFLDFLDTELIKAPFSKEEDDKLIKISQEDSCDWKVIRKAFPQRPFNMLKRRLKKLIPGFKIVNCMKYCRKSPRNSKSRQEKIARELNSLKDLKGAALQIYNSPNTASGRIFSDTNKNSSEVKFMSDFDSDPEFGSNLNNVFDELKHTNTTYFFLRDLTNKLINSDN